jgi:flagellar basal-body rod protein FlgG
MMRALWIAKTGLEAQQAQMDQVTHNLANVNTTGFKKGRALFEDLLYQTIRAPGAGGEGGQVTPVGYQVGTGARIAGVERLFTQGNMQKTENPLDVAISGGGFLQVTMPDGALAYTRSGALQKNNQGQVVTSEGYLLQPNITVPDNTTALSIAADGTVLATVAGQATPQNLGQIELAMFVNPAGLSSAGKNLYVETEASGAPLTGIPGTEGRGVLEQGYLETSNVNVAEELVQMIATQRAYELNTRAITAADQMLQRLAQL